MAWRTRVAFALAVMLVLTGIGDAAPINQTQAFQRWKIQDRCILDAVHAHPDRTVESMRARDGFVDKCLADNNLPPRAHVAPPAGDAANSNEGAASR